MGPARAADGAVKCHPKILNAPYFGPQLLADLSYLHTRIDQLEEKLAPKPEPEGGTLYDQELVAAGLVEQMNRDLNICEMQLGRKTEHVCWCGKVHR